MSIKIGVLSDTHGLLRSQIHELFKDCNYIIHAGDIGSMNIPHELSLIAETIVVQGNMDRCDNPKWADTIEYTKVLEFENVRILVAHEPERVTDFFEKFGDPPKKTILIYGHTHLPTLDWKRNLIRLNPGAAGNTNLRSDPTIALIEIDKDIEWICFRTLNT